MQVNEIDSESLFNELKSNPDIYLLDIREQNEIEIAVIQGAHFITMNQIPSSLDLIPKDKKVVIYCHHGVRSYKTGLYLVQNEFNPDLIFSLKGGIDDWAKTVDLSMATY